MSEENVADRAGLNGRWVVDTHVCLTARHGQRALRLAAIPLAAATMLLVPAGSSASTLGQTGAPVACQDNRPWVPDSAVASYTAPVRGVITSWSTLGSGFV